jgi:hypothetical protein
MPFNRPSTEPKLTSWPPKPPVQQLTRADLKNMAPEAIEEARAGGALQDLLGGKKPAPPEGS